MVCSPLIEFSLNPSLKRRENGVLGNGGDAPFGVIKVFFPIYPLLGATGLVLTRLSRASNTLKEVHWGWSC